MWLTFKYLIVLALVAMLVACGSSSGPNDKMVNYPLDAVPPRNAMVQVTRSEDCTVRTQSVERTCGFLNDDRIDQVCQAPSKLGRRAKKVTWVANSEFTLSFTDGHPFRGRDSKCDFATAKRTFTCKIRRESQSPALKDSYEYTVIYSDGCVLDPVLFLIR